MPVDVRLLLPNSCVLAALIAVLIGTPNDAHAWTTAQVRGANAKIQVLDAPQAQVTLTLRLHIGGGWLSELELPGLSPTMALDPSQPVSVTADSGEKYTPEMVLRRGVWRVVFSSRHSAPWRGDYTLTLVYREPLATLRSDDSERQQLRWTMPPWRLGIEAVGISIDAPKDAVSIEEQAAALATTHHVTRDGERTLIEHHRAQLPRDTEWTVAFELPDQGGVIGRKQPTAQLTTVATGGHTPWPTERLWLPTWLLLAALLKHLLVRRHARGQGWRARPLIALPHEGLRVISMLCLAAGAAVAWPSQAMLAMGLLASVVLLAIDRSFDVIAHGPTVWRAASADELRLSLWTRVRGAVALHRLIDATTWLGASTLLGTYALLVSLALRDARQQPALIILGLLIAPLWTTATAWHLPWDGVRMARELQKWMRRHQALLGDALSQPTLLAARDESGRLRDVRVALSVDACAGGLNSVDLVWVTDARSMRRRVALFAQAQSGSAADTQLRQLPMAARRNAGSHVVHAIPAEHVVSAIHALREGQRVGAAGDAATNAIAATSALGRAAA